MLENFHANVLKELIYPRFGDLLYGCCSRRTAFITGSPSSPCVMIVWRDDSDGKIIGVCMGIFTIGLRK